MKLSVVVPTRARSVYLREALITIAEAVRRCPVPVEVVISDNASEDSTSQVCAESGIPGLIYVRQPARISMRQNFEAALDASTGSHVIFIGDDDALAPHGLILLAQMIDSGPYEIFKWRVVDYTWPDTGRDCLGSVTLRSNKLTGRVRQIDPKALLRGFARGNVATYRNGAMIYHGCISRTLIDRVRAAQGGTYFWTTCPDVYASLANLLHTQDPILTVDLPVTIGGASPRSNGTAGKEYTQTANTPDTSEYARFLSELQGDRFLGRAPATCASINLVTLDALQLSHQMAGRPLSLEHEAWVKRLNVELAGLAPAVAAEAKQQAQALLGSASERIVVPATSQPSVATRAPAEPEVLVELLKVRLTGGAAMAGIVPAVRLIDWLCAGDTPLARLPRSATGMLVRAFGMVRRAKDLSAGRAQS